MNSYRKVIRMNNNETNPEKNPMDRMGIGTRISELRSTASMTQERLAGELDVSVQYISRLERGMVGMSTNTLIRLCEVLKVSSDYILFGNVSSPDVSPVVNRLKYLTPSQLSIVERSINITIEALENK